LQIITGIEISFVARPLNSRNECFWKSSVNYKYIRNTNKTKHFCTEYMEPAIMLCTFPSNEINHQHRYKLPLAYFISTVILTLNVGYFDYVTFYNSKRPGLNRQCSCCTESLAGVVGTRV